MQTNLHCARCLGALGLTLSILSCEQGIRDESHAMVAPAAARVPVRAGLADSLASLADSLLALEREAAQIAFGDASGQSEGNEDLLFTTILSSVRVAEIALASDSTAASPHVALGMSLMERSYRGFGAFDSLDLARAEHHLREAIRILPPDDPRRSPLDNALSRVVHNRRPQ